MIEDVVLRNFISHKDTKLQLSDGVNIFIGRNGAGKSSVIDAVTYALYGKHTRNEDKNLLRRGALSGSVSVRFTAGGKQYLAERRLGRGGRLESAVLRDVTDGDKTIAAGERKQFGESMSGEVAKIVGLDYEKMKVATIVHQGELDTIIRYQPRELKELINGLIGIDLLDVAFTNSRAAIEGFRARLRNECMGYDDTNVGQLEDTIKQLEAERRQVAESLKLVRLEIGDAREAERALSERLAVLEVKKRKVGELTSARQNLVSYVEKKADELRRHLKELQEEVPKAKQYLFQLERKGAVESELAGLEEKASSLSSEIAGAIFQLEQARMLPDQVADCEAKISNLSRKVEKSSRKLEGLNKKIRDAELMPKPTESTAEELTSQIQELENLRGDLQKGSGGIDGKLRDYQHIIETGVCPTCDTRIGAETMTEKIRIKEAERESIERQLQESTQKLSELKKLKEARLEYDRAQADLQELRERLRDLSSEMQEDVEQLKKLEEETAELSGRLAQLQPMQERLDRLKAELSSVDSRKKELQVEWKRMLEAEAWLSQRKIAALKDVEAMVNELNALTTRLESLPADPSSASLESLVLDEYSSSLVSQVSALEAETRGFREEDYKSAKDELEGVIRPKLEMLIRQESAGSTEESQVEEQLKRHGEALEKVRRASKYAKFFEKIRDEVYNRDGILATSLRSWALKEMADSASKYIRLFGVGLSSIVLKEAKREVTIECYSSAGFTDVNSMSGGEKVAVALALRFGMASLMGRGRVDFIVLDEPTTHLDVERRKSLVKLIDEFNSVQGATSLNQIIIITHDEDVFEGSEVNAIYRFEASSEGTQVSKL